MIDRRVVTADKWEPSRVKMIAEPREGCGLCPADRRELPTTKTLGKSVIRRRAP